jgi:tetratricopeptide (TPR) repeat protein
VGLFATDAPGGFFLLLHGFLLLMAAFPTSSEPTTTSSSSSSRPTSARQEMRQDGLVTLADRALYFVEDHRALVIGALAAVVLTALGVIGYGAYQEQQEAAAQEDLAQIVSVYERGAYEAALEGTGDRPGLLTVIDAHGGTKTANLARYYAADAYFQLGQYDEALRYFEAYDKAEDFLGAGAIEGQAAIYENRGEFARAAEQYERAATHFDNTLTSPRYLLSAGRAYEEAGDLDAARRVYETVRDDYPDSAPAREAPRHLARVQAQGR